MGEVFRNYEPTIARPCLKACAVCYARKVRCDAGGSEEKCAQCSNNGVECRPRTRKRRATTASEHDQSRSALPPSEPDQSRSTLPPSEQGSLGAQDERPYYEGRSQRLGLQSNCAGVAQGCQNGVSDADQSRTAFLPSGRGSLEAQDELPCSYDGRRQRLGPQADCTGISHSFKNGVSSGEPEPPLLFVQRNPPVLRSLDGLESNASKRQRTSSFLSRSAILGDDFQGIDHSHSDRAEQCCDFPPPELEMLRTQRAFELPDLPTRQSLLETFVERCYPWMPVLELEAFGPAYLTGEGSTLLFQAVTLVGTIMRSDLYEKDVVDDYYKRLKALILSGYERDVLNTLAGLCLIQWYTTAAPKDVTADSPRFWNTYAVGLAHQVGLHRTNSGQRTDAGLRRRIWFTLCARDCLTSSAHGRPRLLCPADSDLPPVREQDFPISEKETASLFRAYVEASTTLGDLCQAITRNSRITAADKEAISARLIAWAQNLPAELHLIREGQQHASYSLALAQLHIPRLVAIIILYRPSPIFAITASNVASVTAAFLSFRIFQSMHLRGDTKYLGSAFAWYLLVVAIPMVAAAHTPGLLQECSAALDCLEACLTTLGQVRPAAAINLKSVKAIRRAASSTARPRQDRLGSEHRVEIPLPTSVCEVLGLYGADAVEHAVRLATMLRSEERNAETVLEEIGLAANHRKSANDNAEPQPSARGQYEQHSFQPPTVDSGIQDAFSQLLEEDLFSTDSSWMMHWLQDMPGPS